MARFEPFERDPFLAVAVSGGADSMALALLAAAWAAERGGQIVALTVDHGLRPESAEEARTVGAWLMAHGIPHRILEWRSREARYRGGLQAAARAARYRLLDEWCREAGCLHLLTAHHREDQGETVLLRLARGSGLDGLAAMAPVRELAGCRLLRPLLAVSRQRLRTFLAGRSQAWIEDPSNRDPRHARARLRSAANLLDAEGFGPARLAATARQLGRARAAIEREVARCLAEAMALYPAGYALLRPGALDAAADEVALRALAAMVAAIGGAEHAPRLARLEALRRRLGRRGEGLAGGRTLGGCRFLPWSSGVLVCREPRAMTPPVELLPGRPTAWDGRFVARLVAGVGGEFTLGALGRPSPDLGAELLPAPVRPTLPAIRDLVGLAAVPHLHYVRPDRSALADRLTVVLRPRRPLTGAGFTVD